MQCANHLTHMDSLNSHLFIIIIISILQIRKLRPGEVNYLILGEVAQIQHGVLIQGAEKALPQISGCFCSCDLEYLLLRAPWTFTLPHSLAFPGTRTNPTHLSPEAQLVPPENRQKSDSEQKKNQTNKKIFI